MSKHGLKKASNLSVSLKDELRILSAARMILIVSIGKIS